MMNFRDIPVGKEYLDKFGQVWRKTSLRHAKGGALGFVYRFNQNSFAVPIHPLALLQHLEGRLGGGCKHESL